MRLTVAEEYVNCDRIIDQPTPMNVVNVTTQSDRSHGWIIRHHSFVFFFTNDIFRVDNFHVSLTRD